MGQCTSSQSSRRRRTTGNRQGAVQSATRTVSTHPSTNPPTSEHDPVSCALNAIKSGRSFEPTTCSTLYGLSTSSHAEFSVLPLVSSVEDAVDEYSGDDGAETWSERVDSSASMGSKVAYRLLLRPFVGPNAGRQLVYSLICGIQHTVFASSGSTESNLHLLPPEISSVEHFLSTCIRLTYHNELASSSQVLVDEWIEEDQAENDDNQDHIGSLDIHPLTDRECPSLLFFARREVVCCLDKAYTSAQSITVPRYVLTDIFGMSNKLITIEVSLWPQTAHGLGTAVSVQEGVLCCEFAHILRQKVGIPLDQQIVLYHGSRVISSDEKMGLQYKAIDCFIPVPPPLDDTDEDIDCTAQVQIVLSLVGIRMSEISITLAMSMKDVDSLIRRQLNLSSDSFLVLLPEGTFSPGYTTCSGWQCVYPFTVHPAVSRGSTLRQSLRQHSFSNRRQTPTEERFGRQHPSRRSLYAPRNRHAAQLQGSAAQTTLANREHQLETEKNALRILSSVDKRHFPFKSKGEEEFGIPLFRLHHEMSMYQLTAKDYGISPDTILQVYEVTGPAVPIASRARSTVTAQHTHGGNLMDVNPTWPLLTFAWYVDAMMSPSSAYSDKIISCGNNSIRTDSSAAAVTLKSLFCEWQPPWWNADRRLTRKDLLASDFLTIQTE